MPNYDGHPSWNAWNVSLWINNDEGLYRLATECILDAKTRKEAARTFLSSISHGETPDGAPYTLTNVIRAMRGMEA